MSLTQYPAGGVTNTGNAAVGDVATGKTFSSAVLTNATGTSTKNATVPTNAPIRPFQVWVDKVGQLVSNSLTSGGINLSNQGITSLVVGTNTGSSDNPFACWLVQSFSTSAGFLSFDLSGNDITDVEVIDQILTDLVTLHTNNGILGAFNVSGGTNAAPTQNAAVVAGAGTTAVNGTYTQRGTHNGKPYYNLIGQADDPANNAVVYDGLQWAIVLIGSANTYQGTDVAFPWNVDTWTSVGAGIDPVPTVTSTNGDKATLTAAGWTVTTN